MYNQNQISNRWQSLDMMKTLGILGALGGHILIWWFGKNNDPAIGNIFYSIDTVSFWQTIGYLAILVIIHLLFISAGAAFYFYLKNNKPTFKKILSRSVLFIFLGILFGLSLQPFILFWNVFLFYAFSILIIFIMDRYGNKKMVAVLTLGTLILTPLLRLFLNKIAPENYLSAILIGDPLGKISFYPFFPWFFLIGSGFLTSYFYSRYQNKRILTYGVFGGIIIFFATFFSLKPLDLSNIFGATSQIPINYIIFIFSFFIFLISLFELIFKKRVLSKYNPAIAIGRHILPVYLITIIITLPLTNTLKNSARYGNNIRAFLILELITLAIACMVGTVLTYWSNKRSHEKFM